MAKLSPLTPVNLSHPSVAFSHIQDTKINVAQMEGSRILKNNPKELILAFPIRKYPHSFFDKRKRARIVTRVPGELTLIFQVSKEYLSLNARPPLDMEEEMRLSVLRYQKAKEEESRKQAKAAMEAIRIAEIKKAEYEAKAQAELEAESREKPKAESQVKVEEGVQLQQVASQIPFNSDDTDSQESYKRAINDGGVPVPMSKLQVPSMEEIRQALITTTNQMYLSHKQTAKASMIKRRVRKQFQLHKNFFEENGWPKRCDIIILWAFKEARDFEVVGY